MINMTHFTYYLTMFAILSFGMIMMLTDRMQPSAAVGMVLLVVVSDILFKRKFGGR